MSLTTRPYLALLEIHRAASSSNLDRVREQFTRLPQEMRNRIFGHIYDLAESPQNVEWGWGEIHVFDSLPRLQTAVQRIAFEAFDSLSADFRNMAAARVYTHAGSPQTPDSRWGETHAKDNAEILLQSLDEIRTDLSPLEIREILDAWVSEDINHEERRYAARNRILAFVGDPKWGRLDLSELQLSSLPQVFHANVFATELKNLFLSSNRLQTLSEQIGRLQALQKLNISHNQLQSLPKQIGDLQELQELNVSFNQLQTLPEQICRLQALQKLNVKCNQLQSLPEQIGRLQALQGLDVYSNKLQSLPEQIGRLQALQWLDVANNRFLSLLPEQIGQLQALLGLFVSCNRLQSLPEQIGGLRALQKLHVDRNRLQSLPEQIGQLQALEELRVESNQLQSLPEQIGRLQALQGLDVSYNRLQTLPEQIGRLQELEHLICFGNGLLTGLPMQILDLPRECQIDLSSTGLSSAVLARLREATSSRDYRGPRIEFSMENFEGRTQERPIEELLQELFSLSGQPVRTFDSLMSADRTSLHSWLSRLSYTADYKKGGERQKAFARKVLDYMQLAEENPKYREEFFLILADASQTCGDRVALSILKLGMAHRMMTLDNFEALTSFLVQTVWPVQMLEEIARNKVPVMPFVDEVEVYLAYPVKLREVLGLEIDVEQMLYFTCSSLKQQDLDEAAEFVKRKQADRDAVLGFLIENARWMEMFKKAHSDEVEKIEEEAAKEVEDAVKAGASREQYAAIQSRRNAALKALFQKSLKD